jgi:hypothetical protein
MGDTCVAVRFLRAITAEATMISLAAPHLAVWSSPVNVASTYTGTVSMGVVYTRETANILWADTAAFTKRVTTADVAST